VCGRYRLSRRAEILAAYDAEYEGVDWDARYNIAPTQNVPIIRQDAKGPIPPSFFYAVGLGAVLGEGCDDGRSRDK
jgi:putative SOS response-associated peptidase YedK